MDQDNISYLIYSEVNTIWQTGICFKWWFL